MSYELAVVVLALGIIGTLASVVGSISLYLVGYAKKYLLGLLALIICIPALYFGNKYAADPQKEYESNLERIRNAEAEMAKFLVLHPEFKEVESERE